MYYYRKYRKMGTLEISIIVSLIATFGHYIAWWAAYLEKYYEMVGSLLLYFFINLITKKNHLAKQTGWSLK